jgi:CheY-like chemotaxis protein
MASALRRDEPVILLVVDDDHSYQLYSELLANDGYRVVGVGDGREAAEYALLLLPDLIVMDLSLRGIDGQKATRLLRRDERSRHIPIVALTGVVEPHDEEQAFEAGCSAIIRKAWPTTELMQVIQRFIEERPAILLVDDDDDIRSTLFTVLTEEGFRVAASRNGQEAIEYLHAHRPPCLILLDLMMPIMNGWQFCAAQSSDPELATIPVIVLTASSEGAAQAASLAVSDVLSKPLDLPVLLDAIERIDGCR